MFRVDLWQGVGARAVPAPQRRRHVSGVVLARDFFLIFFFSLEKWAVVAGLTHFGAAALPISPVRILKLGDRTLPTGVPCGSIAGGTRARRSSAATLPVRLGWVILTSRDNLFHKDIFTYKPSAAFPE